jgi:hypothetical protein
MAYDRMDEMKAKPNGPGGGDGQVIEKGYKKLLRSRR